MTSNKSQKTDIRQRMSETGEPYSVARHAVLTAAQDDDHDTMLAEPDAPPDESPHGPRESRLEHDDSPEEHDDSPREHDDGPEEYDASPEEQYLRDAEAAGLPADELIQLRARLHAHRLADEMRTRRRRSSRARRPSRGGSRPR